MTIPDITIAVDGYSSTGKSTFAKLVAKEFGFLYLDSGAMYRGVTLFAMENGMAPEGKIDEDALQKALPGLDLHFQREDDKTLLYSGPRCIESLIRTLEVSALVSPVSAIPFVRSWVDDHLHAFSEGGRVIMDGRDIGTTVFPNAEVKIFMTAEPAVRAQRRYDELVAKGESPSLEDVMKNLQEKAQDAFVLDNTHMTLHEELVWMLGLLQGRFTLLETPGITW